MAQYAFYFNSARCTGCKTCQVACKETYKLGVNNLYRRVLDYQGGSWAKNEAGSYVADGVFCYRISISCNHCESPACVENCPTGATTKSEETGIVTVDQSVCIGCETCVKSCPYGTPTLIEETGTVNKCNMCEDLVAGGEKPLCVTGCPMRALDFGTKEELINKYGELNASIAPLPQDTTGACLIIKPHPAAQKSSEATGMTVNLAEEL